MYYLFLNPKIFYLFFRKNEDSIFCFIKIYCINI